MGVAIKDSKDGTTWELKSMSAIALRPFLPADAPRCLEIFHASIEEIASEDYDVDQRAAWRSRASDPAEFASRLAQALTLDRDRGGRRCRLR